MSGSGFETYNLYTIVVVESFRMNIIGCTFGADGPGVPASEAYLQL